jgi:hypothetical protein
MRRFKISTIFETRGRVDPKLAVYPTIKAHLDAAQKKGKGLSLFSYSVGYMAEGGREYFEVLEQAFKRDLVVVLQCKMLPKVSFERQAPRVFVAHPEELWRIPAFIALWETAFADKAGWGYASEAQQSLLLGYTAKQRARWIDSMKQWWPGNGQAAFMLLTRDERDRVVDLGMRCLGSPTEMEGMQLYANPTGWGVKENAFRQVPVGHTLARIGLHWKVFLEFFGAPGTWGRRKVLETTISKTLAKTLSRSLRSNVQFLTARGWK